MTELLDALAAAALEAGEAAMRFYGGGTAATLKADGTPVTQADEAAEAVILAALARLAPAVPAVAEEQAARGLVPETGARFFLVDPVDGTQEFLSQNGEFTVNVALVEEGRPVLGVVHAPALGRLFAADREGAWEARVRDGALGARTPLRTRPVPERPSALGSRRRGAAEAERLLAHFGCAQARACGSSLKFCLLAAGEADLYPRFGPTMEWDTAAGEAVLRAAGGCVRTLDGGPLLYGKSGPPRPFANPSFVAFGDPALAARLPAGL